MENFTITIHTDAGPETFEVRGYLHHDGEGCKFEVFKNEAMVLALVPDGHYLRTCKDTGALDEEVIHRIIEKVEELG